MEFVELSKSRTANGEAEVRKIWNGILVHTTIAIPDI